MKLGWRANIARDVLEVLAEILQSKPGATTVVPYHAVSVTGAHCSESG